MNLSAQEKRMLVEKNHPQLSVVDQCLLLGLARSNYYHEPLSENCLNIQLMHRLDELYTNYPFFGIRKMTEVLRREGYLINPKRIHRLMRQMGLQAIYQKPNLSKKNPEHRIYPYLLRGLSITHPNQVWSSDITYIRLQGGFVYLVAVIDWYSRYVLSWELSNSLDKKFCLIALERALRQSTPSIFNTDQGSQFTSEDFTGKLIENKILVSMDGRGRYLDNIFVERLWRTVKYEDIYLKGYSTMSETYQGLSNYFSFYNNGRLHQSLDYRTPAEIYYDTQPKGLTI